MNDDDPINIALTDTIDLHVFHPADITAILDEFFNNAVIQGYSQVEIIHGKGKSVVKHTVHNYLKNDKRVLQFFDKSANWGRTIVILKKEVYNG